MKRTERITCSIAVHWIQARIIGGLKNETIDLETDSLRGIGTKIGLNPNSAQKIKHHLGMLVKLGVLNIIDGKYNFTRKG